MPFLNKDITYGLIIHSLCQSFSPKVEQRTASPQAVSMQIPQRQYLQRLNVYRYSTNRFSARYVTSLHQNLW